MVQLSRCRLVKYDEYTDCLDQSFDDSAVYMPMYTLELPMFSSHFSLQKQTFGQMVGRSGNYYPFELFLETRAEDEVFKPYNRGGSFHLEMSS